MLRIRFTATDLARTRMLAEPAPLVELKLALMMFARPSPDARVQHWRRVRRRGLPPAASPLWHLVGPFSGPAFIDPPVADLGEAIDHVLATPAETAAAGIDAVYARRPGPVPPWLREFASGRPRARSTLALALHTAYQAVFATNWAVVQSRHHRELDERAEQIAALGLGDALAGLADGAHWDATRHALEIPADYDREVHVAGRGVDVIPSAHWSGPPLVADQPGRPVLLVYPIGGRRGATSGRGLESAAADADALAGLVGRSRAAVLRALRKPASTGELAELLRLSPASVSEHVSALRAADLVESARDGRRVRHGLTKLGRRLAEGSG